MIWPDWKHHDLVISWQHCDFWWLGAKWCLAICCSNVFVLWGQYQSLVTVILFFSSFFFHLDRCPVLYWLLACRSIRVFINIPDVFFPVEVKSWVWKIAVAFFSLRLCMCTSNFGDIFRNHSQFFFPKSPGQIKGLFQNFILTWLVVSNECICLSVASQIFVGHEKKRLLTNLSVHH